MIVDESYASTESAVRTDAALVHKTNTQELLLADSAQLAEDRFLIGLRWPEDHSLYHCAQDGSGDPILAVETLRQAMTFLSHQYLGLPLGNPCILLDFGLDITDPHGLPSGQAASSLRLDCKVTTRWTRGRFFASIDAAFLDDERIVARGTLRGNAVPPATYQALRRRSADASARAGGADGSARNGWTLGPMPPAATVGRRDPQDVVLRYAWARSGEPWALRIDQEHPVFFDHPLDHVPGMLLLEALRQSSHAAAWTSRRPGAGGPVLVGTTARFPAFCELGPDPVLLEVVATDAGARDEAGRELLEYEVTARQRGIEVACGTTRWAQLSAPSGTGAAHRGPARPGVPRPGRRGGRRFEAVSLCR